MYLVYQLIKFPHLLPFRYHLLIATGPSSGGSLSYHSEMKAASADPVDLASSDKVDVASNGLIRAHGCLMMLAWAAAATSGTIMARYGKETLRGQKRCGLPVWWFDHLFLMTFCVLHSIVGAIVIFVDRKFEPLKKENVRLA